MHRGVVALAALVSLAGAASMPVLFEARPRVVAPGAFPRIAVRSSGAISLLSVEAGDLWYRTSTDGGDSFESPVRVNDRPGEVAAHAENSPQLVLRSRQQLYCLWQAREEGEEPRLRFARSTDWGESFGKPIEVAAGPPDAAQGFYAMEVSGKGAIYVAWLDGRDRAAGRPGTSAVYLARSLDGGSRFVPAVRVALNACPCCRPSIAIEDNGAVHVSFREVLDGDVRDIAVATAADGQTWGAAVRVADDGWRIDGCPHSGATMAALGSRLFVAWHNVRNGRQGIFAAWSDDGGKSFSPGLPVEGEVLDPNHPFLEASGGRIGIVFQGRSPDADQGWGKVSAYYRELSRDGRLSPVVELGHGPGSASYPTLIFEHPGHVFAAWTESDGAARRVVLSRGRERSMPLQGRQGDAR